MKFIYYCIIFLKEISNFKILKETHLAEIHYKSVKTNNETSCWNECENEMACNSISFYNASHYKIPFINSKDNCFLYANQDPKTLKNKNFVSIISKAESNFQIFISNKFNLFL